LYSDLVAQIIASTGAEQEKVEKLLSDLWEQTILLADLMPAFTTLDPARSLVARLCTIPDAQEEYRNLSGLLDDLCEWDTMAPQPATTHFRLLEDRATTSLGEKLDNPFQVDMVVQTKGGHIHHRVGEEAAHAAEVLLSLSPFPDGLANVVSFRNSFIARYNEGREVPLLELLDSGIRRGEVGSIPRASPSRNASQARRSDRLIDLACRALRGKTRTVVLDDDLLAELRTCIPSAVTAPPTLDLYIQVSAPSPAQIDEGDFLAVLGPNIGAQGAGKNLGRFAYMLGCDAVNALNTSFQEKMY